MATIVSGQQTSVVLPAGYVLHLFGVGSAQAGSPAKDRALRVVNGTPVAFGPFEYEVTCQLSGGPLSFGVAPAPGEAVVVVNGTAELDALAARSGLDPLTTYVVAGTNARYWASSATVYAAAGGGGAALSPELTQLDTQLTTNLAGDLVIPANIVPRTGQFADLLTVAGTLNELAYATDTQELVLMSGVAGGAHPVNFGVHPSLTGFATDNNYVVGRYNDAEATDGGVTSKGNTFYGPVTWTPTSFPADGSTNIAGNMIFMKGSVALGNSVSVYSSYCLAFVDANSFPQANYQTVFGTVNAPLNQHCAVFGLSGMGTHSPATDVIGNLYGRTTDASPTLLTDGLLSDWSPSATNSAGVCVADIDIIAIKDLSTSPLTAVYRRRVVMSKADAAAWSLKGAVQEPTGLGDITDTGFAPPDPTVSVVAGGLRVSVTGIAATNIKWRAVIRSSYLPFGTQGSAL